MNDTLAYAAARDDVATVQSLFARRAPTAAVQGEVALVAAVFDSSKVVRHIMARGEVDLLKVQLKARSPATERAVWAAYGRHATGEVPDVDELKLLAPAWACLAGSKRVYSLFKDTWPPDSSATHDGMVYEQLAELSMNLPETAKLMHSVTSTDEVTMDATSVIRMGDGHPLEDRIAALRALHVPWRDALHQAVFWRSGDLTRWLVQTKGVKLTGGEFKTLAEGTSEEVGNMPGGAEWEEVAQVLWAAGARPTVADKQEILQYAPETDKDDIVRLLETGM